jgi:hypothetical protein
MKRALALAFVLTGALVPAVANAQQRPLLTQDPETIGAGRVLLEVGVEGAHDQLYTLSGLRGNVWNVPLIGIDVGVSSIADLQITGGLYDHLSIKERQFGPLAGLVTATGNSTSDVDDINIGMKVRFVPETSSRPSFGFRFSTRLPNAKHESGLGQDTTDFSASLLVGKTVQSVRVVGNLGFTIMSEPLDATKQNDVLTYGLSFARAMVQGVEVVGEFYGRVSTRNGVAPIGTESRGLLKLGGRYGRGAFRADGGVFFGLTSVDPTIGVVAGVTYVFDAFKLP